MEIKGWFGGKIRQARERKRLTVQEVADKAGVSVRSLSGYMDIPIGAGLNRKVGNSEANITD